jgi:RNA polymerase sigma-70 factor (ECF subfamily)
LAAVGDVSPKADEALGKLCETYWYALYAYLRGRGYNPDAAEDLTQSFFARLLEKEKWVLRQADPSRGRFRAFLLSALKNFAANEHERTTALKRGGSYELLSLDFQSAEGRFQLEPPTSETPERVFDRRWATTLLDRAIQRLQDQASRTGRSEHFDHLKMYLTGEQPQITYAEAATELGMSEGAVKVAVHRLRRQFRDLVREEIEQTVSSTDEVEDEMRHLWSAVAR